MLDQRLSTDDPNTYPSMLLQAAAICMQQIMRVHPSLVDKSQQVYSCLQLPHQFLTIASAYLRMILKDRFEDFCGGARKHCLMVRRSAPRLPSQGPMTRMAVLKVAFSNDYLSSHGDRCNSLIFHLACATMDGLVVVAM